MPVDAFLAMGTRRETPPERLPTVLHNTWRAYHRAVAGMAAAGNNVVVDHVLSERTTPGPNSNRRERERGDRPSGRAALQLAQAHAHGIYDVECDTSRADPLVCALGIKEFLPHRPAPTSFQRLLDKQQG
ncbi:phosphotransferase-like protein [Streptomyces capitiformicae]|uniref:Uncharacterized protein n=1 Tax=Streptomyces capitiformicae TaxID=2014920 RepID=A0A918Z6H8_9ACTN|nr:hypothetical protein [Streptomyces capitiformicae]GHE36279.1 hypothetical protein GCM10017771_54400 [Streptomyces capitiformicae]